MGHVPITEISRKEDKKKGIHSDSLFNSAAYSLIGYRLRINEMFRKCRIPSATCRWKRSCKRVGNMIGTQSDSEMEVGIASEIGHGSDLVSLRYRVIHLKSTVGRNMPVDRRELIAGDVVFEHDRISPG